MGAVMADPPKWCATCGSDDVEAGQAECPVCIAWWHDNPPPAGMAKA